MANPYCTLNGASKIKDSFGQINTGFDGVKTDMDAKAPLNGPNFTGAPVLPYGGQIKAKDLNGNPQVAFDMFNGNSIRLGSSSFPTLTDHNGNLLWTKSNNPLTAGTNGYQKLESGFIIQWGRTSSVSAGGQTTVTLPISFPNATRGAWAIIDITGVAAGGSVQTFNITKDNFGLALNGTDGARVIAWLAVGN